MIDLREWIFGRVKTFEPRHKLIINWDSLWQHFVVWKNIWMKQCSEWKWRFPFFNNIDVDLYPIWVGILIYQYQFSCKQAGVNTRAYISGFKHYFKHYILIKIKLHDLQKKLYWRRQNFHVGHFVSQTGLDYITSNDKLMKAYLGSLWQHP